MFDERQRRKLRARLKARCIKARQANGNTLHYLEGWHVISEANRIFGFEGWDRETVASQCVWTKSIGNGFSAAYIAKVRIRVRAGDTTVVREGSGAGDATASRPGQAHELAAKAAETDATKRALSTFGNAFGLSLYSGSGEFPPLPASAGQKDSVEVQTTGAPPKTAQIGKSDSAIDKSLLPRGEPKRHRCPDHLKYIASNPCMVCGREPSHAHHLTFTQPRTLGRKVSDEFTVPLCNLHHRELHDFGNERDWWMEKSIDPLPVASQLWALSRLPARSFENLDTAVEFSTKLTNEANDEISKR